MDITIFFVYIALYLVFLLISLFKIPIIGLFNLLFIFALIGLDNTVSESVISSTGTTTVIILDFQHFVIITSFLLVIQFITLLYKLKIAS